MDRNFLKQSIRRELDYYKDGLFNEDEDEYWERAWAAPDDDDSMAENGPFLRRDDKNARD